VLQPDFSASPLVLHLFPARPETMPPARRAAILVSFVACTRGTPRRAPNSFYSSAANRYAAVHELPMNPKATLLIVDDEPDVREVLEEYFVAHGYTAHGAGSADAARSLAAAHPIDLALVDIHMPGEDGLSLARHLRERYASIAIVMLTSAGTVVDRIVGLEMGADDYVPKPFDPRELLARVKSVLRRTSASKRADIGAERVRIGRCVLDLAAHRLIDEQGKDVPMSPLEFDLLKALAQHPNRPVSRESILNSSQQRDWDPFDRSVDLRIMRLRRKVEPDPEHPQFIKTLRNAGYVFVPDGGE
jgi:two-component system phosphate regulon response regulator OmpR